MRSSLPLLDDTSPPLRSWAILTLAVWVTRESTWTGRDTARDDAETPKRRKRVEPLIQWRMAGVIAERRYTGRRWSWSGAQEDLLAALEWVDLCARSPEESKRYYQWLWEKTRCDVEALWPYVERLAAELAARTTLDAGTIRRFFAEQALPKDLI